MVLLLGKEELNGGCETEVENGGRTSEFCRFGVDLELGRDGPMGETVGDGPVKYDEAGPEDGGPLKAEDGPPRLLGVLDRVEVALEEGPSGANVGGPEVDEGGPDADGPGARGPDVF